MCDTAEEPDGIYRRPLPASCTGLASSAGQEIFTRALASGHCRAFFSLVSCADTQTEPAFCSLSSLASALNALAIDPMRTSLGPWRWFRDVSFTCCLDLDYVRQHGVTVLEAASIARCNGASTKMRRAQLHCASGEHAEVENSFGNKNACCYALIAIRRVATDEENSVALQEGWHSIGGSGSLDEFRNDVIAACTTLHSDKDGTPQSIVIASYSRKALDQSGDGHFSPIGAYDEATDQVLIVDSAKMKYAPHWASLVTIFNGMKYIDSSTGKPRGWIRVQQQQQQQNAVSRKCCMSKGSKA